MAGVALGARADGFVVLHLTVCTCTTGAITWVDTLQLVASLVAGAVVVGGALGVTPGVGVALVVLRTGTHSTAVLDVTVGSLPTRVAARVHTDVVPTAHVPGTVSVADTLWLAPGQWVPDVVLDAGADGAVISYLAVGVAATGARLAQLLRVESPARDEGIANEVPRARADGLVVPDGALGLDTTHTGLARVDTSELLAGAVAGAVIGLNTLAATTVCERVALVA